MQSWQQVLAESITDPEQLMASLGLNTTQHAINPTVLKQFSCRVPQPYFNRIEKNNPDDPLLKQVLPINQELEQTPGYSIDPLAEIQASPADGFLHKYHGRVLVPLTGACAINCRYCFRRHFDYGQHSLSPTRWQNLLDYLQDNPEISEVIFSGGDPLIIKDPNLQKLIDQISALPQISTLRLHTRLPIVIPQRITHHLINMLHQCRLNIVMVVHCNHANEIDDLVTQTMLKLKATGVTLLNQSVLLNDINDDAHSLIQLSHRLFSAGILPYYIHLLDKVQGAAHFDVKPEKALNLIESIRSKLPGYLVPRLAQEVPNQSSKQVIA